MDLERNGGKDIRQHSRDRVLISAYACGPLTEPEASAGWAMATAAAVHRDVWVITRPRFRESIQKELDADSELATHLHVEYLDLSRTALRWKRKAWDIYWYYALWQRAAGKTARRLHSRHRFDVAHHVTFANDWMPCGLASVPGLPLVWGPVGGSSTLPVWRLRKWLGVRGTLTEGLRSTITSVARRTWGTPIARQSALMIAQNPGVAAAFARSARAITVEPNASLSDLPSRSDSIRRHHAVFVGRLLGWKGAALAIDAISRLPHDWSLDIFGSGYDEARLRARVAKLGLGDRVIFVGHRPRKEVLEAIAAADVFLFPSMHDQAGWVVAEASSIGCPVVCLPLGGPPVLAEPNAFIADLKGDLVANVAAQIISAAEAGGAATDRWSAERLPAMVDSWYSAASVDLSSIVSPTPENPSTARSLSVLESFSEPKPTTNPYITQLHRGLLTHEGVSVRTFDFKTAIFGRYDVAHLHWPELMIGGHKLVGRIARRAFTTATILRWRVTRTPVVRTRHNLERPTNINRFDHRLLDAIDAATTMEIVLNDTTERRPDIPAAVIPHGHYRDWFAQHPQNEPIRGRVGYVGLIRRYKGVEDLVSAFGHGSEEARSLHVAGKPSTQELADTLRALAVEASPVSFDFRFLDEAELVSCITESELIVLPYRHMHNSGTALAALSLSRPVLVPDNAVNRALSTEVGTGWVHLFAGALTAADLARAMTESRNRTERPDLSLRDWNASTALHVAAFRQATARSLRQGQSGKFSV